MRKLPMLLWFSIAFAGVSTASITASLDGGTPTVAGPGIYRYTYTAVLQSNVLEPGDYFVLYDFQGYRPSSMTVPNASWTTDDTGTIGPYPGAPISESATVVNLLWVYEGANISAVSAPVLLGKFSAESSSNHVGVLTVAGITDGGNIDYLDSAAGPIPEPSTIGLLAAGFMTMWTARRRRVCLL